MVRLTAPAVFVSALSFLSALGAYAQYQMVKEYMGNDFFDDWIFYNNYDNLTNANVNYLSSDAAASKRLAYINHAGNAIMRVDNTTMVKFPNRRDSIRINTRQRFTIGSVWVVDMLHVPFGCSVWPAFWSSAPTWPSGGEIDTFEGVNMETMGHMGLHTAPGCVHSNTSMQTSTLVNSTDCSIYANSNQGCIITNPTPSSYGAGFAQAGGGVFVTELSFTGVSVWFFPRSSIPDSLQANTSTIDTSSLGFPVANWDSDGCEVTKYFDPQSLVFDIALCGDYAGNSNSFYQTCTGVCYQDWVLGDPSNYDNAYFEVRYVRVYGTPGELTVITSDAVSSRNFSLAFGAWLLGGVLVVASTFLGDWL